MKYLLAAAAALAIFGGSAAVAQPYRGYGGRNGYQQPYYGQQSYRGQMYDNRAYAPQGYVQGRRFAAPYGYGGSDYGRAYGYGAPYYVYNDRHERRQHWWGRDDRDIAPHGGYARRH